MLLKEEKEMSKILKSDGLRGIAVTELSCELMLHIGRAAAQVIGRTCGRPPVFYIGHDPRRSADALESALCAGICSGGGNAVCLGVLSSSALALLVSEENADCGFALTADTSSYEYSGLRILTKQGLPMSEEQLTRIEAMMPGGIQVPPKSHRSCGTITHDTAAQQRYLRMLQEKNPDPRKKTTIRVAVDCANGVLSEIAKPLLSVYGMEVLELNCRPDGTNINNDCGVMSVGDLLDCVKKYQCAAGFAFDGNGERCLAVDEHGKLLDGDRILAILTQDALKQKTLGKAGVAATVMTNLGFLRFAEKNGVAVHITEPMPRFVAERMREEGLSLGGERGGYLYFSDMPASDGLCTALRLCCLMHRTGKPLSKLASVMEHAPQVSLTVRISEKWREIWKNDPEIVKAVSQCQTTLGSEGRILVREHSREPLIQVLLEGRDFERINRYAVTIADTIRNRTGQNAAHTAKPQIRKD